MLVEKRLDRQRAEIGEGEAQAFVIPIPPFEREKPCRNVFPKPHLDDAGRVADGDGLIGDVLRHDRPCADHRPRPDFSPRQHHDPVPDPDVVADLAGE